MTQQEQEWAPRLLEAQRRRSAAADPSTETLPMNHYSAARNTPVAGWNRSEYVAWNELDSALENWMTATM